MIVTSQISLLLKVSAIFIDKGSNDNSRDTDSKNTAGSNGLTNSIPFGMIM